MSDAENPPPRPEPHFDERRSTFNDIRDDFDDNFGRTSTRREIVQRMVMGPAVAFVVIGVIGVSGMIVAACALLFDLFNGPGNLVDQLLGLVIGGLLISFAVFLFALMIVGGVSMIQLRRFRIAILAAYLVAVLSVAGYGAVLFYPFGIWGLIVLYRPDVRREFYRMPQELRDDDEIDNGGGKMPAIARGQRPAGQESSMSDAEDPPPRPESHFDERRPTFNDIRDDYDEDFGRSLTPREVAKRMVRGPAIAFMPIGMLGILGMCVAEVALLLENFDRALNGNSRHLVNLILGTIGVVVAMVLFGIVFAGGSSMLQLRRRWLAMFAAYVVTGMALGGCYGILFYPFGIWGLIVLYRPDVRREFHRLPRSQATIDFDGPQRRPEPR